MKHLQNKRLAIFLPGLYGGGAERTMLNLAVGFTERGFSVDLVLSEAVGPYLSEVPRSVRLVELNSRRLKALRTVAGLPALVRYLRMTRPHALLSALHANVIALWARCLAGIPQRMVICEQNTFSYDNQKLPKFYSYLMLHLVKKYYPKADSVIAVSKGVADDLAKVTKMPRRRVQVIFNPVITHEVEAKVKEKLDHPWFNNGNDIPVVLAIGRLTAQKDFNTLIEAFAKVRQKYEVRLLILGEGEERPKLENSVKEHNLEEDVMLPGFVPNPYQYLAQAALFVLSSRWEGLPTVLIEALYCKTQIIATDCPSGPREILNNGLYGDLVPVGSAAVMAQAIESGLNNPRPQNPGESWMPYEYETIVNQYMNTLLRR
jgi:glycosyltransferase involved in cell wall biosynthesis